MIILPRQDREAASGFAEKRPPANPALFTLGAVLLSHAKCAVRSHISLPGTIPGRMVAEINGREFSYADGNLANKSGTGRGGRIVGYEAAER